MIQKILPKKRDIDKILKVIQRKVLKGTYLPVKIKEIQAGYLNSPYFKDICLYVVQNKIPSSKAAIRKVETLVEWYILLDTLLFKITPTPEKETVVLAVPEICADKIITLLSFKFVYRTTGCHKNLSNNQQQFLYPKSHTLSQILHHRVSYLPINIE